MDQWAVRSGCFRGTKRGPADRRVWRIVASLSVVAQSGRVSDRSARLEVVMLDTVARTLIKPAPAIDGLLVVEHGAEPASGLDTHKVQENDHITTVNSAMKVVAQGSERCVSFP